MTCGIAIVCESTKAGTKGPDAAHAYRPILRSIVSQSHEVDISQASTSWLVLFFTVFL